VVPGAGLIAACDAETGKTRWAVIYDGSAGAVSGASTTDPLSAVVYHGGRLFVKPADSDLLLTLDADSGRQLWSVRCPTRVNQFLGVDSGRLIAAGDHLWGFAVEDGRAWRFGFDDPEGYGFGRGALHGDRIYWTTHDELFVVDPDAGR